MIRARLNVDLGELPDEPEELYALADVANVACGGHAGDEASMASAVALCARHGAELAAHPSYPDRPRFGRVSVALDPAELAATVEAQCAALARVASAAHVRVTAMKPHGALYHDAARSPVIAEALLSGAVAALGDVVVVGPTSGALAVATAARGLAYRREGFADRTYGSDGQLVPRSQPGALLESPELAAAQAARLAREGHETICVHGDTAHAVEIARAVRAALLRS